MYTRITFDEGNIIIEISKWRGDEVNKKLCNTMLHNINRDRRCLKFF